jgi:hypothetical protein
MDRMSQRARDVLAQFRAEESLNDGDRARLLAAIQSRIAAGTLPAHGPEGPPAYDATQGAFAKGTIGSASKVALALLASAGALGGTWRAFHHAGGSESAQAAPVAAGAGPREARPADPSRLAVGDAAPPSPPIVTTDSLSVAVDPWSPRRGPDRLSPVAAPRTAVVQPETAPAPNDLPPTAPPTAVANTSARPELVAEPPRPSTGVDEEVRLLGRAYSELRSGRPAEALATIAEHERRFPNGKLAESRQVARILSLCDSGQAKAALTEGRQFLATHPGSPFSSRVRTACAE